MMLSGSQPADPVEREPCRSTEYDNIPVFELGSVCASAARRAADPESNRQTQGHRHDWLPEVTLVPVLVHSHRRSNCVPVDEAHVRCERPEAGVNGCAIGHLEELGGNCRPGSAARRVEVLVAVAAVVGNPAAIPAVRHLHRHRSATRRDHPTERGTLRNVCNALREHRRDIDGKTSEHHRTGCQRLRIPPVGSHQFHDDTTVPSDTTTSVRTVPTASFRAKQLVAAAVASGHRLLRRPCGTGNRIVTFHAIDTEVDGDSNRIYDIDSRTFTNHLRVLHDLNSAPDGLRIVPVGIVDDRTVAISFDDGYASTLTIAAPQLVALGLPFCVFVTPMFVDSDDRRYLDRRQLVELSRLPGVTIGAHGYRHVPLSGLNRDERRRNLADARSWLEDAIQRDVRSMSYPFGDTPDGIDDDAAEAGYELAACSAWGFNDYSSNRLMLRRIDLWAGDSRRTVMSKIEGRWNRTMGGRTS